MLYLDHAATTPVRPAAREAMAPFLDADFGNPLGVHGVSRRARVALDDARERAAALVGAEHPLDVVFTGGGTESDNLGVAGVALAGGKRTAVVTTAVEHDAVLETGRFLERLGCPVRVIGVDETGVVGIDELSKAIDDRVGVVSVMAANNETGVVQPMPTVAEAVSDSRALLHTDAVQFVVSRDATLDSLRVDLLTLSAHKFGGPKGVGLLALRPGVELEPVLHGGGQEVGRRSGTHNVAGIVGMVAALEDAIADRGRFVSDVSDARARFEKGVADAFPDMAVTAGDSDRLVQHSHLRIPGVDAETLLVRLDGLGVAAAAGSACHSGAIEVSHVLGAMGLDEASARESVRFTFGWTTRPEDGDAAASAVIEAAEAIR